MVLKYKLLLNCRVISTKNDSTFRGSKFKTKISKFVLLNNSKFWNHYAFGITSNNLHIYDLWVS